MLELKLTFAVIVVSMIAAITPYEQAQVICAAVIGAGLGGLMGSYFFPGKAPGPMTLRRRWASNLATGTICGPLLTDWMRPRYFPDSPVLFVSLFSGGAVGALGVLLLTVTIPPLSKWIVKKLFATPPNSKE